MPEVGTLSTLAGYDKLAAVDHHGRRGVLGDHEPGVDPGILGQEGGQADRAGGVEQPVDATFRHGGRIGQRDGEEVAGVAEGGAVEVAVGLDATVREHDRVVDRGRELTAGDGGGELQGVASGPEHLGCAAHRVGVLYPDIALPVRRDDLRLP